MKDWISKIDQFYPVDKLLSSTTNAEKDSK
jgi:hypothetical protein